MAPTVMGVTVPATVGTTAVPWSCIRVTGADATTFLQSQLSQDLSALGARSARSALLEPDGTVVAAVFVSGRGEDIDLVVSTELADATIARLRRFRLRARCEFAVSDETQGPYESEADRVGDGWPGAAEFAARLGPHSFGRRFVSETVSFAKGCFTGQELVARLDARGANVPWRLVEARGPSTEPIDTYLRSTGPDGPSGVTSSVIDHDGVLALGFAHRSLLAGAVPEGLSVRELP